MSRKPKPLEAYHHHSQGGVVAAKVGLYALGHVAKKPQYQCTSGLTVHHWGVEYADAQLLDTQQRVHLIKQHVRCRKCDGCRNYRRAMWAARAIAEAEDTLARGKRTWFLTATHRIRPDRGGDDLFAREITLAVKRLRKLRALRYMIVFERHQPRTAKGEAVGYPHCHGLIHEIDTLKYSDFKAAFGRVGFFEATLVKGSPAKAAGYVAKYLTKTENPKRVRASFRYGAVLQGQDDFQSTETPMDDSSHLGRSLPQFATTHAAGEISPSECDLAVAG